MRTAPHHSLEYRPRALGSVRRTATALALIALLVAGGLVWAQRPVVATASTRDPFGLDPTHGRSTPDRQLITNIFSGLVRYARGTNEVEPDLATHWTVSPDGREYTFFLRDDVRWHKGYGDFTAHDVKYTFDRIRDPATGSRYRPIFEIVAEVEVIDDYTVRMTLAEPSASFLSAVVASMGGLMVNRRAIEEQGDDAFRPIGTGPFQFVSYEPRQRVVLEAFADFYRGPPEVERVEWSTVPDQSVQALALQRGDLNYLVVTDVQIVETLRSTPGVVLTETPATGYYGYALNTRRPPFDDVRVRQALAHAIDKELFVDAVLAGQGAVTHTVIPSGMFGHAADLLGPAHDPERSRSLLAEAGHAEGLVVEVLYNASDGYIAPLAVVLQQWMEDVGVTVRLQGLESGAVIARRQAGEFDVHVSGPTRVDPDELLTERFYSASVASGTNHSFYASLDAEIEAQRRTIDPAARAAILRDIQVRILADAPEVPVYAPVYVTAHADYLTGDMPNTSNWIVYLDELRFTDLSRCLPCR